MKFVSLVHTSTWNGKAPNEWKEDLLKFFLSSSPAYDYHIGDLDDFLFPYCNWIICFDENTQEILEVILRYNGSQIATILIYPKQIDFLDNLTWLLKEAKANQLIPDKFYSHFTNGVKEIFSKEGFDVQSLGPHFKYRFKNFPPNIQVETSDVIPLDSTMENDIISFFKENYPGNYFSKHMLATNRYYGIKDESNSILCVCGVHVFAPKYKLATLGNICTSRGKGLAKRAVKKLVQVLIEDGISVIGLNVESENEGALKLYSSLGFHQVLEFEEAIVTKKQ